MKIIWNKKESIPIGVEDSFFNIIDNTLLFSCGYCGGITFSYGKNSKHNKYNRELKISTYKYDLNSNNNWIQIDDFPGERRQCGRCVTINNKLYMYGGYSFVPSSKHKNVNLEQKKGLHSYSNGFSIDSNLQWTSLIDLPEKLTNFGMTSYNNDIYICCGGYIDNNCSQPIIHDNNKEYGRYLYKLNINNYNNGWEIISKFPGTLRFNCIFTQVNGIIYILGGIIPNNNWKVGAQSNRYMNVCDNWKYNINENKWDQINIDISNGANNWGYVNDNCVYKNRYILIIGGCAYENQIYLNKISKNSKFIGLGKFRDNILFYDTVKNKVITSKTKLFCKMNNPMFIIINNKIYIIGGESIPFSYKNEKFGKHSDIFIEGTIED